MSDAFLYTEFRALLARNKITQREFAKIGGWTDMTVNCWCTGRNPIPKCAWVLLVMIEFVDVVLDDWRGNPEIFDRPEFHWYEILGVGAHASSFQITAAYRKLAKHYHPDVSKIKDRTLIQRVNQAYETGKKQANDRRTP
jgi:hypothetical protein